MNTQTLELDLSKDGLGTNLVRVGQGDKGGTTLRALIYDGGAEAALTGFTGYLEVLLPNKAAQRPPFQATPQPSPLTKASFAAFRATRMKLISHSRKTAFATQRSASQSRF